MESADQNDGLKFGCVRFDDPHTHDTGWAAKSGGNAYRIRGTEDLSSDTVWMTNLGYDLMNVAGLGRHARFRRSEFIAETFCKPIPVEDSNRIPYDLTSILGVPAQDWRTQVERVAILFDRVMRLSQRFIGLNEVPIGTLSKGLREVFFPPDRPLDSKLAAAIKDAVVFGTPTERARDFESADDRLITFCLPRVAHAVEVMNTPLPAGTWRALAKGELPAAGANIEDWVNQQPFPFVARITVEKIASEHNRLLNFGSGKKTRKWVTGQELIFLSLLARVVVHEVYMSRQTVRHKLLDDMIEEMDPIYELSPSVGLFMENVWLSLTSNYAPDSSVSKGKPTHNVMAPFVRANDLLRCFTAAMSLQNMGLTVTYYGKGKLTVQTGMPNDELVDVIRQISLIPPALGLPSSDLGLDQTMRVVQEIYISSDFERLEAADKQIVDSICE